MKNRFERINNISSDAVQTKTGKSWAEWIAILDRAGAKKMTHKEIVAYLHNEHNVGDWWQQMVTVGYEQARGLRETQQMVDGYQVGASKTFDISLSKSYALWYDEKSRARCLPAKSISISKATHNKSIRATWKDGKSHIDVNFYVTGKTKSQVVIEHSKLTTADQAKQMKNFWTRILDGLSQQIKTTPLD